MKWKKILLFILVFVLLIVFWMLHSYVNEDFQKDITVDSSTNYEPLYCEFDWNLSGRLDNAEKHRQFCTEVCNGYGGDYLWSKCNNYKKFFSDFEANVVLCTCDL